MSTNLIESFGRRRRACWTSWRTRSSARLRLCATGRSTRAWSCRATSTRTTARRPSGGTTRATCGRLGGRRFGFELVFFKRRTDLDRFGVVPLRLIANPLYLAHFAVTDESRGDVPLRAPQERQRAARPARRAHEREELLPAARQLDGARGARPAPLARDARRRPRLRGGAEADEAGRLERRTQGIGVSFKDHGEASRYFSFTRMEAEGDITWHGAHRTLQGLGVDGQGVRDVDDDRRPEGLGLVQRPARRRRRGDGLPHPRPRRGARALFPAAPTSMPTGAGRTSRATTSNSTRPRTGAARTPAPTTRAAGACASRASASTSTVTPVIKDQELDTRGTTMIVYWEGACAVERRARRPRDRGPRLRRAGRLRPLARAALALAFIFGGALDRGWRSIFG